MADKDTLQETYNTVVSHLIKQWGQAFDNGLCRYRAEDGRMCAIGVLIADRYYKPLIENTNLYFTSKGDERSQALARALRLSGVDVDNPNMIPLLSALQGVHDQYKPPYWPQKLRKVGENFGLDTSMVDRAMLKRERAFAAFSAADDDD